MVRRDDLHSLYSEQYNAGLRDSLPEEMVGALQATAQAANPNWSVTHFVWALEPPGRHGSQLVRRGGRAPDRPGPRRSTPRLRRRSPNTWPPSGSWSVRPTGAPPCRAQSGRRESLSQPKQAMLKVVYSSPRRTAAFRRAYGRLG